MQKQLAITLFGEITFCLDSGTIQKLPRRVGQALLIYLLQQPTAIPREYLAYLFFQTNTPQQARTNLRATLSRIKKQVGPILEANRSEVWVSASAEISSDVQQFTQALSQQTINTLTIEQLHTALALYKGDFLAGFSLRNAPEFEQWMVVERERLRLLAIGGLQQLVDLLWEAADYTRALTTVSRLLAIEPLLDDAHRIKMELLLATGQRAAALQHYEVAQAFYRIELGVDLASPVQTLYNDILANKSTAQPTTPTPIPHNLPTPITPFIGRKAELATIHSRLAQPDCRLLTLLGQGGIGKSRLAIAAATAELERNNPHYKDGIYFVPLAAIRTEPTLIATLLAILGISKQSNVDPLTQLTQFLSERQLLLILDNFEQLTAHAELLLTLIRACPQLTLLVTTRNHLDLFEEWIVEIVGLDVEAATDLFVGLASRWKSGFSAELNHPHITRICQLTAGIPLALELAAARIRQQDCATIAQKIAHSIDFLATQSPSLPARQRTMRAIFNASWELLSAAEQRTLAQIAIFRDGFSASAFEYITAQPLSLCEALIGKSLVQRISAERYDLHETIRQFAWEHATTPNQIRTLHTTYYFDFAIKSLKENISPSPATLTRFRLDLNNLRSAWQSATTQQAWTTLEAAIFAIGAILDYLDLHLEGLDLFTKSAQLAQKSTAEQPPPLLATKFTAWIGNFSGRTGDITNATEKLTHALATATQYEDTDLIGRISNWLAFVLYRKGDYANARTHAEQALEIGLTLDNIAQQKTAYSNLGAVAIAQADFVVAKHALLKSSTFSSENKVSNGYAMSLINLGYYHQQMHEYAEASACYEESLTIFQQTKSQSGLAYAAINLASIAYFDKKYDRAQTYLLLSYKARCEIGDQRGIMACLSDLANLAVAREQYTQAKQYLREGFALATKLSANQRKLTLFAVAVLLQQKQQRWSEAVTISTYIINHPAINSAVRKTITNVLLTAQAHISQTELAQLQQHGETMTEQAAIAFTLAAIK